MPHVPHPALGGPHAAALADVHAVLGRLHAAGLAHLHAARGRLHAAALAHLHAALGRLHAAALALRGTRGQGTVEYVGLILLVSVILAGVVAAGFKGDAGIAKAITEKLKDSIDGVGGK